jgi:hypothetical protein
MDLDRLNGVYRQGALQMLEVEMKLRQVFTLCLCIGLLLMGPHLQAEIHKWVDDKGRVHYSDRPVTGKSTAINIKKGEASPAPAGQGERRLKMQRMLDVYAEERAEKQEEKQKRKAVQQKSKKNCIQAKDRYNSHLRATGIYSLGNDGKRQYLSEDERSTHMKRLKADIARWCR